MSRVIRGSSDPALEAIKSVFADYEAQHPHAEIDVYRYNPVSIRIRIIDPDFAQMGLAERDDAIWPHLEQLPAEIQSDLPLLLLLTPDEAAQSFANAAGGCRRHKKTRLRHPTSMNASGNQSRQFVKGAASCRFATRPPVGRAAL